MLPPSPSPCHHPRTAATKGGHEHGSCFVTIAISLSSSSPFTSLQPKVPLTLHPARRNPAQLLTFYCFCFTAHGWADEIFSAHAPQTRGRRGQPGKSCLKPFQSCLPTLPCCMSGPCLPQLLCNTFAVFFPLNTPQGKKKPAQRGVVLLGQAELRQGKKINFSEEQFRFFFCSSLGTEAELLAGPHSWAHMGFGCHPWGGTEQDVPRSKSCVGGVEGFLPSNG